LQGVAVIDSLLNLVFRCAHRRLTRPVTPVAKSDPHHIGTYVVCLDCGKRFSYDPKEMRLGRVIDPAHQPTVAPTGDEALMVDRLKRALLAVVPAIILFFLALFGIKRQRQQR
jgi:hypothetical protein